MTDQVGTDPTIYKILVNHEEQFSIWPAYQQNPAGWRDQGEQGNRQQCLGRIRQIWTDMRPQSLRNQMALQATHKTELAQETQ